MSLLYSAKVKINNKDAYRKRHAIGSTIILLHKTPWSNIFLLSANFDHSFTQLLL